MTVTAALEEAYAANPHGESLIETAAIDHVTFSAPIYIATGTLEDIALPLTLGGSPVMFLAVPFSLVLPGAAKDGPGQVKLRINDVNGVLTPYLKDALQSTEPIEVTLRIYTTSDLSQPGDVYTDLFSREITQDATGVETTLTYKEIELQAFPLRTYDDEYYPTLQDF